MPLEVKAGQIIQTTNTIGPKGGEINLIGGLDIRYGGDDDPEVKLLDSSEPGMKVVHVKTRIENGDKPVILTARLDSAGKILVPIVVRRVS